MILTDMRKVVNIKRVRVGTSKTKSNIDGSRNIKPTYLDTFEDKITVFD